MRRGTTIAIAALLVVILLASVIQLVIIAS
jgi:hypothetical protein